MTKYLFLVIATALSLGYIVYLIATKSKSLGRYAAALLIICIAIYATIKNDEEAQRYEIVRAFMNDKKVVCEDIEIDKKLFNLVTGTSVFLGKAGTKYNAYIIPLSKCAVEVE